MRMFRPDYLIDDIYSLPLDEMKAGGIRHILFDVDNTIVPYNSQEIPERTVPFFESVKAMGFHLCILSNNTDERVAPLAARLGIDFVAHAKKPLLHGAKKFMEKYGASPEAVAMVGDQLLTDMACGNRAGFTTFVVKPINPDELWITKWNRNYEKLIYRILGIKR